MQLEPDPGGQARTPKTQDPAPGLALVPFYEAVRAQTLRLCEPLAVEDYNLQSMPDASPVKWHLAHTSWFFETFLLQPHRPGYRVFHPQFAYLFNSYYNAVGERLARAQRGVLSRPSVAEVLAYRQHIDAALQPLLAEQPPGSPLAELAILGLNHEQQHQELILTDLAHGLACNPLRPAYRERPFLPPTDPPLLRWIAFEEGIRCIGHSGEGFAFDNELPRHRVYVQPFALASRLVTCGEYRAFIEDGGYRRPDYWLSDGWDNCRRENWSAPLYWEARDGRWWQTTLTGFRPVADNEPVTHVSYYEADAYARWAGARLPIEAEWETAAALVPRSGSFLEGDRLAPAPARSEGRLQQMLGEAWQWTASAYTAYPGYRPPPGALGEYNGKFMCNQFVLRGGSCATPRSHFRISYRNFFPPAARWQFTGIRLARESVP
jgi:ergothioneine biosynthesis protein EgtB